MPLARAAVELRDLAGRLAGLVTCGMVMVGTRAHGLARASEEEEQDRNQARRFSHMPVVQLVLSDQKRSPAHRLVVRQRALCNQTLASGSSRRKRSAPGGAAPRERGLTEAPYCVMLLFHMSRCIFQVPSTFFHTTMYLPWSRCVSSASVLTQEPFISIAVSPNSSTVPIVN